MKKKKRITFSGNFLTKDNSALSQAEFEKKFKEKEETEIVGDIIHTYSIEFHDTYMLINFSDGSTFPRNPNVFNTNKNKYEPNPRSTNQIEPKDYFALIDFQTCFLWLSNSKKRNLIIDFIRSKFKKSQFVIKDVFDEKEFIKNIKRLDDLRISSTPDIFSQTDTLTEALADEIHQYGATEAVLHLKYQDKWVGNSLTEKIKSLFQNKNNYKGLMISGKDEKNNGLIFNLNIFSKKIDFKSNIDDNEMFSSDEVFKILMQKIEDEKI
jgi:hypothetical protein|tara:strand:- start:1285 stop:2085 length:801 start_codon:yes stop_codon:yes gene_type:complete